MRNSGYSLNINLLLWLPLAANYLAPTDESKTQRQGWVKNCLHWQTFVLTDIRTVRIPPQNEGGIHIIIQKMIVPSLLIWMSFIYKRRQKSPLNLQRVSRYWIQYPPPLCIIDKGVGGKIQYPPPLCIINKGVGGKIQYPPPLCIIVIIIDKRLAVPRLIPGILFSKDESFSA